MLYGYYIKRPGNYLIKIICFYLKHKYHQTFLLISKCNMIFMKKGAEVFILLIEVNSHTQYPQDAFLCNLWQSLRVMVLKEKTLVASNRELSRMSSKSRASFHSHIGFSNNTLFLKLLIFSIWLIEQN